MHRIPALIFDRVGLDEHAVHFTSSQRAFVNLVKDWISNPRKMFVILSGGPGTGKTFIVVETLKFLKTRQLRMAFTARSANALQGCTIHSAVSLNWTPNSVYSTLEEELKAETDINVCIQKSECILEQFHCSCYPNVIVIDEVGMINGWTIYWLVRYFMDRTDIPILFIMMGDRHQLYPVNSKQNIFSFTNLDDFYESHTILLTQSKRFDPNYEILIDRLRVCVDQSDADELFKIVSQHFPVVEEINSTHLINANRAMAFKNVTVHSYNQFYLKKIMKGQTIRLYRMTKMGPVRTDYTDVKSNCLIFVTQNGYSKVSNGCQLLFDYYDADKDVVIGRDIKTKERIFIFRNNAGMFPIEVGFAATVHKFQGQTIDDEKIVIHFDASRDLNLVYTALSRVRNMDQILAICL